MTSNSILLETAQDADLPAGEFSNWLNIMSRALEGNGESDVPCGDCDACCRASYFIEVKPEDEAARQRIPAVLLFDAPGAPTGYQLLGYDQKGRCPMLESTGCTLYADRPQTCRTFDCRLFAATGIAEADPAKADVTARAKRWQFHYADDASREQHITLRRGARLLRELQDQGAADELPRTATQLAMLAVQLQPAFLAHAALFDELEEQVARDELSGAVLDAARAVLAASTR